MCAARGRVIARSRPHVRRASQLMPVGPSETTAPRQTPRTRLRSKRRRHRTFEVTGATAYAQLVLRLRGAQSAVWSRPLPTERRRSTPSRPSRHRPNPSFRSFWEAMIGLMRGGSDRCVRIPAGASRAAWLIISFPLFLLFRGLGVYRPTRP